MRAIVLASSPGPQSSDPFSEAGDGPLCMTPIGQRPLLHWQIDALRAARVDDVVVVRGHRRAWVQAKGVRFEDDPRWARSREIDALRCVRNELRGDILISRSNVLYPPPVVRAAVACSANVAVVCDSLSPRSPQDPVFLQGTPPEDIALVRLSAAGSDLVRSILRKPAAAAGGDLPDLLGWIKQKGTPVRTVSAEAPWMWVKNPGDVERAARLLPQRGNAVPAGVRS